MANDESAVPLGDIPPELMDKPALYSVTLVGIEPQYKIVHCGSGTLVKFDDRHFILTANHCAKPLYHCERIGFPIRLGGTPFTIQKLPPIYISERITDEWGPDLAFIPLDPVDARNIHESSNKTFYNLNRHEDEMLAGNARIDRHLWAVVGSPISESNIRGPVTYEFKRNTYSAAIESTITRDAFDYLEARASLGGQDLTHDFMKGVSGGGVWYANLGRNNEDGSFVLTEEPRLEGVAFYRTDPDPSGGFLRIRCHGRRSIYERGLAELRFQQLGQK